MSKRHVVAAYAAALMTSMSGPLFAQEIDPENPGRTLPEECSADFDQHMKEMTMDEMHDGPQIQSAHGSIDMSGMSAAHVEMMAGMEDMDANMMKGMMAEEIDMSFICGMIPHHQGAIDMARAELAHGTDPAARELAQQIIDAQVREINFMREWVAKRP